MANSNLRRTLIGALFITIAATTVTPQVKPAGEVKPLGKSIPGLDIIVKRTPPRDSHRFSASPKGDFDLGVLPAGHYLLTVVRKETANSRTPYYESPCKPCYGIALEGTARGKVKGIVQYRETDATLKASVRAWLEFDADGKQKIVGTVREEVTVPKP